MGALAQPVGEAVGTGILDVLMEEARVDTLATRNQKASFIIQRQRSIFWPRKK